MKKNHIPEMQRIGAEPGTDALRRILDDERDRWRDREAALAGTQDLYLVGVAHGAQQALRRVRERIGSVEVPN